MRKDFTAIELILISAICFILGFVIFFRGSDEPQSLVSEPTMEDFDYFPLKAWQTIDKDGLHSETDKGTPNLKDWRFAFRGYDTRGGGLMSGFVGGRK